MTVIQEGDPGQIAELEHTVDDEDTTRRLCFKIRDALLVPTKDLIVDASHVHEALPGIHTLAEALQVLNVCTTPVVSPALEHTSFGDALELMHAMNAEAKASHHRADHLCREKLRLFVCQDDVAGPVIPKAIHDELIRHCTHRWHCLDTKEDAEDTTRRGLLSPT
jgi:hypothetical protein